MAKVTFTSDIQSISGKLCSKEGVVYSVNKRTGRTSRSDRHSFVDANTAKQQAQRAKFKTRSEEAKTWWTTNKPASSSVTPTDEWTMMQKLYKAQTEIGNPWSYVLAMFVSDADFTGFTTAPAEETPSGGGGNDDPDEEQV